MKSAWPKRFLFATLLAFSACLPVRSQDAPSAGPGAPAAAPREEFEKRVLELMRGLDALTGRFLEEMTKPEPSMERVESLVKEYERLVTEGEKDLEALRALHAEENRGELAAEAAAERKSAEEYAASREGCRALLDKIRALRGRLDALPPAKLWSETAKLEDRLELQKRSGAESALIAQAQRDYLELLGEVLKRLGLEHLSQRDGLELPRR